MRPSRTHWSSVTRSMPRRRAVSPASRKAKRLPDLPIISYTSSTRSCSLFTFMDLLFSIIQGLFLFSFGFKKHQRRGIEHAEGARGHLLILRRRYIDDIICALGGSRSCSHASSRRLQKFEGIGVQGLGAVGKPGELLIFAQDFQHPANHFNESRERGAATES